MIVIFLVNWRGIFSIAVGLYILLLGMEILPVPTKDEVKREMWLKRFSGIMKILGPIIIILGVLQLVMAWI